MALRCLPLPLPIQIKSIEVKYVFGKTNKVFRLYLSFLLFETFCSCFITKREMSLSEIDLHCNQTETSTAHKHTHKHMKLIKKQLCTVCIWRWYSKSYSCLIFISSYGVSKSRYHTLFRTFIDFYRSINIFLLNDTLCVFSAAWSYLLCWFPNINIERGKNHSNKTAINAMFIRFHRKQFFVLYIFFLIGITTHSIDLYNAVTLKWFRN